MIPPPQPSPQRGGNRTFPPLESFMCFLCLLMPGMTAGLLTLVRGVGGELWIVIAIVTSLVVLFGCCAFAGWISVTVVAEEQKAKEAIKSACLMLLLQVMVAPILCGLTHVFLKAAY